MAVASDYPLLFVVTVGHRSIRQCIGSYYTVALLHYPGFGMTIGGTNLMVVQCVVVTRSVGVPCYRLQNNNNESTYLVTIERNPPTTSYSLPGQSAAF